LKRGGYWASVRKPRFSFFGIAIALSEVRLGASARLVTRAKRRFVVDPFQLGDSLLGEAQSASVAFSNRECATFEDGSGRSAVGVAISHPCLLGLLEKNALLGDQASLVRGVSAL
jgi:hypothetical protein